MTEHPARTTVLDAPRRQMLARLAAAAASAAPALAGLTRIAAAAEPEPLPRAGDYPGQPIHVISPFPAGGGNDLHMRLVTNELARVTGQPVVAENRGGAGGNIGTRYVAAARPDGYTLLVAQLSIMAVNPVLYKAPGFDPIADFAAITQINAAPLALVVAAESPLRDMADLRAMARAHRGSVHYASPGNGTLSHLLGVVLEKDADIAMTHVPYRGAAPALVDLMGGQVTLMITSAASAAGAIAQRKLRAIALSSPRRSGVFASVATLAEQGLPGLEFDDWYGFFAPAGTPPQRLAYLNQAIVAILKSSAVAQKIVAAGGQVVAGSAAQLAEQLLHDTARWSRVVQLSGMSVE